MFLSELLTYIISLTLYVKIDSNKMTYNSVIFIYKNIILTHSKKYTIWILNSWCIIRAHPEETFRVRFLTGYCSILLDQLYG